MSIVAKPKTVKTNIFRVSISFFKSNKYNTNERINSFLEALFHKKAEMIPMADNVNHNCTSKNRNKIQTIVSLFWQICSKNKKNFATTSITYFVW